MSVFTSNIPVIFTSNANVMDVSAQNLDLSGSLMVDGSTLLSDVSAHDLDLSGSLMVEGTLGVSGTLVISGRIIEIQNGYYSSTAGNGNITFTNAFTNIPTVTMTIIYSGSMTTLFSIYLTAVSKTGFSFRKTYYIPSVNASDLATEDFYWIAIGS